MTTSAFGGRFEGKLAAERLAHVVNAAPAHDGVGAGEIDVFEDAGTWRAGREGLVALDPILGDDDDLAVLDLPHEAGADDVERAGFGGEDGCVAELAEHQRADAQRIADADELFHRQEPERIGAFDPHERIDEAHGEAALALGAPRDQMDDDLGVGGRLKDRARRDQLAPQRQRIGQVAVMGERQAAGIDIGEERLHIPQRGFAYRRIADMADSGRARQAVDDGLLVEVVADEPEAALGVEPVAIEADDAGRFLSPVLEGMQAESGQGRGIGMIEDAENAAFFMQLIAVEVQSSGLQGAYARISRPTLGLHRYSPRCRTRVLLKVQPSPRDASAPRQPKAAIASAAWIASGRSPSQCASARL